MTRSYVPLSFAVSISVARQASAIKDLFFPFYLVRFLFFLFLQYSSSIFILFFFLFFHFPPFDFFFSRLDDRLIVYPAAGLVLAIDASFWRHTPLNGQITSLQSSTRAGCAAAGKP